MCLLFDGQSDEREEKNDEHANQCSKVIKDILFNEDGERDRKRISKSHVNKRSAHSSMFETMNRYNFVLLR